MDTELELLSRPDAAKYLRVCLRTFDKLTAAGDIPSVKVLRRVLIDRRDLDNYVMQQKTNNEGGAI